MRIGRVELHGELICIVDVDGTKEYITVEDGLDLLAWLQAHKPELEGAIATLHWRARRRQFGVDDDGE